MPKENLTPSLTRALACFASQAEFARALGEERGLVNDWTKAGRIPATWAVEVERVTGGEVKASDVIAEAFARRRPGKNHGIVTEGA